MKKFLLIVQKHVNRLTAIVEDLKRLSQIERTDEDTGITLAKGSIAQVIQDVARPLAGNIADIVRTCGLPLIRCGAIGKVRQVYAWSSRPSASA